jgi:AcrR family transcriptional regulator
VAVKDRKARERARREREILEAALELFRRDDWEAVTIEQIARAAEVGKGTIYKHFETKDELYARLAADFHESLLAQLKAIDPQPDVRARLRSLLLVIWESYLDAGSALRRVLEHCDRRGFQDRLPEGARRRVRELASGLDATVGEFLEAGVAQRLFPRKPMELLAFGVRCGIDGGIRAIVHGDVSHDDADTYLAELANFVVAGLTYQGRVRDEPAAS